jgi:hypothetical protein
MHFRTQPPRREAEQAAAGTNVEKRLSLQVLDLEHRSQRQLGLPDVLLVQDLQKPQPVFPKGKTAFGSDFECAFHVQVVSLSAEGIAEYVTPVTTLLASARLESPEGRLPPGATGPLKSLAVDKRRYISIRHSSTAMAPSPRRRD